MEEEDFPTAVRNLQPCRICGRTFNPDTLRRHEGICEKNASKTRKTFQSEKQRTVSDVPVTQKKAPKSSSREVPVKSNKNNWRQKHAEFLQTVRAARGVTKALKEGKELPPPPPPTINPDYVQCPHCMRRFNENAAERHIKFCADQHKRLETRVKSKTVATSRAAEKQERRISYRPPMPSSGLRRTANLSSTSSGYLSSGTQGRGQQRPTKGNAAVKMTERSKTDVFRNRFNDDSTFDTSLPASAVVTTRTGLKARVLASNSSSDIDSSDFDVPKRGPGRRAPAPSSYKHEGYNDYYQPSSKSKSTRSHAPTHTVTKYDWDFNFDDSAADAVKRNGTRKTTNSRSRQETGFTRHNVFSSTSRARNEHSHPERDYENSLNDFVAREFGSKYKSTHENQQNRMHVYEQQTSPFNDFTVNNNRYKGQGEPAPIVSKDTSFASDGSKDSYGSTKPQNPTSRFCHECGSRYPIQTAKFCCECGMRRIHI